MRLFLTVGTQLPFDRLVRGVDECVGRMAGVEAFAQIGPTKYQPKNMQWRKFVDAGECKRRVAESDFVVAHAGMGSILTALDAAKPIIVMARRAALGEHRNEHQVATAQRLAAQGWATVADDVEALFPMLQQVAHVKLRPRPGSEAIAPLLRKLRAFVIEADHLQLVPAQARNSDVDVQPLTLPAGAASIV